MDRELCDHRLVLSDVHFRFKADNAPPPKPPQATRIADFDSLGYRPDLRDRFGTDFKLLWDIRACSDVPSFLSAVTLAADRSLPNPVKLPRLEAPWKDVRSDRVPDK
jgi:hypothetical protein